MEPETALRIIASLVSYVDGLSTFHGEFSYHLAEAKDTLSLLRDEAETSSTSTLQRDVLLYLAQSI